MALRLGSGFRRDPQGDGGNSFAFHSEKETSFDAAAAVSGSPVCRIGHSCYFSICTDAVPDERRMCVNTYKLRTLIFLALCCDLGLFVKRIVNPFTNLITDALHIPGGVGTSFSLMFLVVAAALTPNAFCGTIMGVVQSVLALGLGMVGSMGVLSPIGYIVPGIMIDLIFWTTRKTPLSHSEQIVLANAISSPCAALSANFIVFHLRGVALLLYLGVAATSGAFCGLLGAKLAARLMPVIGVSIKHDKSIKKGISI